jgi:uncharacterized membrane protein YtjA (UPF0391 family)
MKYSLLTLFPVSLVAALLGFTFLSGTPATVCRVLFMALFILGCILAFWSRRAHKSVYSTFASSFKNDPE